MLPSLVSLDVLWAEVDDEVFPCRVFLGRQLQWRALRIEESPPGALRRRAEQRIGTGPPGIDDVGASDHAVGLDRSADLDDEVLGVARAGIDVPAARDLLADEVEFASGQLAAERRPGLRRRRRGGGDLLTLRLCLLLWQHRRLRQVLQEAVKSLRVGLLGVGLRRGLRHLLRLGLRFRFRLWRLGLRRWWRRCLRL